MIKKMNTFLSLVAVSSVFSLSSCNKVYESTAYGINQSSIHNQIFVSKVTTRVKKGRIVSSDIEEVYTPSYWAKVSNADKDKLDVIEVSVNSQTINYAKYIQVGNQIWIGALRDSSDKLYNLGEYIKYSLPNSQEKPLEGDLITYITPRAASSDLGSSAQAYYDAYKNENIKLLKLSGENNYTDSMVLPAFTDGKIVKGSSRYTSYYEAIDKIDQYFSNKQLNYKASNGGRKTIVAKSGTWCYNPSLANIDEDDPTLLDELAEKAFNNDELWEKIEGATASAIALESVQNIFACVNKNFVALEYKSVK